MTTWLAADKGTATFSDIANKVSFYQHWLGDAFASGGSQGYDHRKWNYRERCLESVKLHFREMGKNIK